MGFSKTDNFTDKQLRLSELCKALGHPARIAILELLLSKNSCICGDIVDELPLSQSTVSQHLKELKSVGIIKGEISGTKSCYCIDAEVLKEMQNILNGMFNSYKPINNCC